MYIYHCAAERTLNRGPRSRRPEPSRVLPGDLDMSVADGLCSGALQGRNECLFVELDASTFMNNFAGGAGGAVGSTSASLPVELR